MVCRILDLRTTFTLILIRAQPSIYQEAGKAVKAAVTCKAHLRLVLVTLLRWSTIELQHTDYTAEAIALIPLFTLTEIVIVVQPTF